MTSPSPAHLRRSPSQQRSRDRVERILDAAVAIVDEEGLDALKVVDIAKRAAVPLGTLYQFFARKDDIVYALAERFAQRFAEEARHLRPLPAHVYDTARLVYRLCDAEACIARVRAAVRG